MSETLILAAIMAPLVLVPAIILSLQEAIDPICRLGVEFQDFNLPVTTESQFARFEREMIGKIVAALGIPKDLLTEPYVAHGFSLYAESLKRTGEYGGWL